MAVLLIDTNLWSYLSAETDPNTFAAFLRSAGHEAAVNSEMLTEGLSTSDPSARTRIVDMMGSRHWRKLHANAHLMEIVDCIRRLRGHWLRSIPRTDRLVSMDDYWTRTYYREAREDPEGVMSRIHAAEVSHPAATEIARIQARNKEHWPFLDGDMETPALLAQAAEDHMSRDPGARLGWPTGTPVRMWRIMARDTTWAYLQRETVGRFNGYRDTTYTDSLGAFVDIGAMMKDREGFNTLFLFDVDTWEMPRAWWRGTVETLQHATKLAVSNGMDATHASYLPDCDYMLTADRRFYRVLAGAANTVDAPKGGVPVLVKPHEDGWLAAAQTAIGKLPPPRRPSRVRTVHVGGSYTIGDGAGQVSPRRAMEDARTGSVADIHRGPAELIDEDGRVVVGDLAAVVTNSEEYRPQGIHTKYFGTIHTRPGYEATITAATVRTLFTLRWIGDRVPTRIFLSHIDPSAGIGSFAVNGSFRSGTSE